MDEQQVPQRGRFRQEGGQACCGNGGERAAHLQTEAPGMWGNERLSLPRPEDKVAQSSGDSPVRGKVGVEGRKPDRVGTASPVLRPRV